MHDTTKNLIIELYKIGAIKFGEFTLKSGANSQIYIDLRQIISYPELLLTVSTCLLNLIKEPSDLICGVPYTALPIATAMSLQKNIPMILRRKEKKPYGTQQQIEGVFCKGQTCLVIEDVTTTGSSVLETIDNLNAEGLIVNDIAVIIDREQGAIKNLKTNDRNIHVLFTITEILTFLQDGNLLSKIEEDIVNKILCEKQT